MIEKLKWDSDFFGYAVGRINATDEEQVLHLDANETRDFKLVYIFSDNRLNVGGTDISEVDIKTTLIKNIKKNDVYPVHTSISEYAGGRDGELKRLALESGVYSRFKRDPKFVNNEFLRLYTKWIEDSINKKIADKLIIFHEKDIIMGFVSVKFKDGYAEIGLIAVDSNSRGKGVALALLTAAFDITQKNGFPCIRIVTQFENVPAMKLYLKAGFELEKKKYIYHLWN